jgi:hypothetical protein
MNPLNGLNGSVFCFYPEISNKFAKWKNSKQSKLI